MQRDQTESENVTVAERSFIQENAGHIDLLSHCHCEFCTVRNAGSR